MSPGTTGVRGKSGSPSLTDEASETLSAKFVRLFFPDSSAAVVRI